jgi:GTPase SAR1 family protein
MESGVSGDRIRVLVVGDSRVGKTALVHLLCYGEVHLGAASTVGAKAEVKVRKKSSEYREDMMRFSSILLIPLLVLSTAP